jgi:hypothetical protein
MSDQWHGGKGSKSRISSVKNYTSNYDNIDFSKKITDTTEVKSNELKIETSNRDTDNRSYYLILDDIREPQQCFLHDERKTLQQVSGIPNSSWDIVRSYDDFVAYIENYGIPKVVSFDNDLDPMSEVDIQSEMMKSGEYDNNRLIQKTGCDCAEYLANKCKELQKPIPKYYVHSANTFARPKIRGILESARPLIKH